MREEIDAEALVRDDLPILTQEILDEGELASAAVDIQFSFGTGSLPVFRQIATLLAAVRDTSAIAVGGVGHLIHYHPEAAAAHIRVNALGSTGAASAGSPTSRGGV